MIYIIIKLVEIAIVSVVAVALLNWVMRKSGSEHTVASLIGSGIALVRKALGW